MAERPILFNTEMVRAILEGRKTQTRRACKGQPQNGILNPSLIGYKPPFHAGDILWVRETWKQATTGTAGPGLIDLYLYKADEPQDTTGMMVEDCWHPSIHMPRAAARLFLRVISVTMQRLQDIDDLGALAEGVTVNSRTLFEGIYRDAFARLWDSTVRKSCLPYFGWDANPWVWVIEFARCDKPAGLWADRDTAQYADQDVLMPAT